MAKLNGKDIIAIMKKAHLAKFQKKTVAPKTVGQTVRPDEGYDGLSEVEIGSSTLTAKKTVTPKVTAQTINPDSGDIGLLGVVVNATPLTSQKTVTPKTTSQTINPNSGDLGIKSVVVNATPLTSQKTVTPGASNKTIVPDSGDLGLTGVVVEGDTNLIAENIKENVSIFGVVGTVKAAGVNKLASVVNMTLIELTAEDLDGVINIRRYVFESMPNLTSITIPSTVKTITDAAFRDNYKLASVEFSPNSQITSIGSWAFQNSNIKSITIPESVTECGSSAFYACELLDTINWNATECSTKQFSSSGGDGLFISGGNTNISLKTANIGANVHVIPDFMFKNCARLQNVIIPDNSQLTKIGKSAFYNCDELKSIDIPDSVTVIDSAAFIECNSLKNVSFGENSQLTTIGDAAFWTNHLISITIPRTVTSIGGGYCLNIGNSTSKAIITMLPITPPAIQADTFVTSLLDKIIVPKGCGDVYKAADIWSSLADYIEEATE